MEVNFLLFLIFIVLFLNFLLNLVKAFPEVLNFKELNVSNYICIFNILLAVLILHLINEHSLYKIHITSYETREEIWLIIIYSSVYFFLANKFKILSYTVIYSLIIPHLLWTEIIDITGNFTLIILILIGLSYTIYQIIKYKELRKHLANSIIVLCLILGIRFLLEIY